MAKPPPDWDDLDKPKPPWWDDLAWWNVPDVLKPDWWDELAARIAADRNWYAKYGRHRIRARESLSANRPCSGLPCRGRGHSSGAANQ